MADNDGPQAGDHDLLARLNALRKSNINLDDKTYRNTANVASDVPVESHPARDLHADLLARFKSLTGQTPSQARQDSGKKGTPLNIPELQNAENDKTVEELLAELGPDKEWVIKKSDEEEIENLLRDSSKALKVESTTVENRDEPPKDHEKNEFYRMPNVEMDAFRAEPNTDDEDDKPKSSKELKASVDTEADEYLQQVMDDIKNAPPDAANDAEQPPPYKESVSNAELPATPTKDLPVPEASDDADADLESRFASLGLPSVPSNAPITKTSSATKPSTSYNGYTEEDLESWCCICNDDATLQCIGCDGDLYCLNCWMEGHRGESAGFEEKKHKAVQYVKKRKKDKEPQQRVAMGAR